MISQTKAYRTDDGKLFETELEAAEHELRYFCDTKVGSHHAALGDLTVKHARELLPLIQRIAQAQAVRSGVGKRWPKGGVSLCGGPNDPHREKYRDLDEHEVR